MVLQPNLPNQIAFLQSFGFTLNHPTTVFRKSRKNGAVRLQRFISVTERKPGEYRAICYTLQYAYSSQLVFWRTNSKGGGCNQNSCGLELELERKRASAATAFSLT